MNGNPVIALAYICSKHIYMYPPAPLVSRPHPRNTRLGLRRYVDDTILAGLVSKNPKIWMTELCRLSSSVGRALVRITGDQWFESRLRSTLFCHTSMHVYHVFHMTHRMTHAAMYIASDSKVVNGQ